MSLAWDAVKDPDDIKDYNLNWTARLEGDTISSSTWTIVDGPGLAMDSDSNTTTVTTVWLSGGTIGTATLLNRVVTASGRRYDQTVKLKIKTL